MNWWRSPETWTRTLVRTCSQVLLILYSCHLLGRYFLGLLISITRGLIFAVTTGVTTDTMEYHCGGVNLIGQHGIYCCEPVYYTWKHGISLWRSGSQLATFIVEEGIAWMVKIRTSCDHPANICRNKTDYAILACQ